MQDESYSCTNREVVSLACGRTARIMRKARFLSQEETAMLSNICQSYLSNIEQGRNLISLDKLCLLSHGLNYELKECFELLDSEITNMSDLLRFYDSNDRKFKDYRDFGELVRRNIDMEILTPDLF